MPATPPGASRTGPFPPDGHYEYSQNGKKWVEKRTDANTIERTSDTGDKQKVSLDNNGDVTQTTTTHPNGSVDIEYPDGGKKHINPDGSGTYTPPGGGEPQPFGPGEGGGCM